MTADVVHLNTFRKPENLDVPALERDKEMFSRDAVADEWANKLVHGLMTEFFNGADVDSTDPIFGKLMEGLADVTRSMTRHHLDVFDETALMLQKYPEAEVSVGVLEYIDEDEIDG